jgi:hypothetical protein
MYVQAELMTNNEKPIINGNELSQIELQDRGLAKNEYASIGEILSKKARHELTKICVSGITEDARARTASAHIRS